MKADAKLVYFFQKNKFCLLKIEKKLLFSALGIGRATKIWFAQGCERTFEGSPFKGSRSKGPNLVLCNLKTCIVRQ